jgi:hypothetical protein
MSKALNPQVGKLRNQGGFLARPERLELPTYWFEAINDPPINNLDEMGRSGAVQYCL